MLRVKKLIRKALNLRDHNAQTGETCAVIKALNKLSRLRMPKTKVLFNR